MNVFDKNQWLKVPDDYTVTSVYASGAFLVVVAEKALTNSRAITTIFLNSDGREVARTLDEISDDSMTEKLSIEKPAPVKKSWVERFCDFWMNGSDSFGPSLN